MFFPAPRSFREERKIALINNVAIIIGVEGVRARRNHVKYALNLSGACFFV
jgi:hypothetical protein